MKYLSFICRAALEDFSRNKMRTFLTSLGILIGVMSVILLIALGLGLKKYINNQFESLGSNLVYVMPGSKKTMMRGGGMIGGIKFDDKDLYKLQKLDFVSHVAPIIAKIGGIVTVGGNSEIVDVIGSTEEIVPAFNLEILYGRLLDKRDISKASKVVMTSEPLIKKLFKRVPPQEVLGEYLSVDDQNYKVVGIVKSKGGGGLGSDLDSHLYIPVKSASNLTGEKKYYAIYIKLASDADLEDAKKEMTALLSKRYDEDEFSVLDQADIMGTVSSIFGIINIILVAIAAISLLVGGIGVMNIMYVSVTERIKEIGIRRAVGAKRDDILWHFLTESVMLSLFGGFLGLGFAYLIVLVIQIFLPAYIDIVSIILAVGVSTVIGVVFGVLPAKKAAELSPIDAIRYE